MLNTLLIIYKIGASTKINGLLYSLKKVPILGRKLKSTDYSLLKIKSIIGAISIPFGIVSTFIKSFLIFFVGMYLPSILIVGEKWSIALSTLIFFLYYIARLANSHIMGSDLGKFIMIKQMGMDSRHYSIMTILSDELITLLINSIIFALFLDLSPYTGHVVVLALTIFSFNLFSEALHLFLFKKYNFALSRHENLWIITLGTTYVAAYALALISPFNLFLNILLSPILPIVTIALGILSGIYIYRYDDYTRAINLENNIESLGKKVDAVQNIHLTQVKLKDKDFKEKELNTSKFDNKEGFNYLNALFFDRHKRAVHRPMIVKSLIIIGVFLIYFIVSEFVSNDLGPMVANGFYVRFNLLVFAMYLFCNSERIIKSMFYNCDLSLLRYGFYKKGDALLKMFTLRLLRIVYSNIIPTSLLAIGIGFSIMYYTSIPFLDMIPIILLLYVLAMFFSVHYIFMYYIFQPFNTSMEMKNPFYGLINSFIYFVSYLLMQVPAPPKKFLPITMGLLVLYTIIAIVLVYKKAPKTFKIR